jgi:DNA polymerase III alpha subunit
MNERDILIRKCVGVLKRRGLYEDPRYVARLKKEMKEIDAQAEHEYYLGLYQKFQAEKLMFPQNEFNNLVDWLLELVPDFDIDRPSEFIQGEFPDIDVDLIKEIRDWMKKVWAIQRYGQDYVCEIGTYGTLGIKSAMLDMSRVYGVPRDEIQGITVRMEDKVDDGEGKKVDLDWDKALEIYPEFKAFCDKYPDVASAAKAMQDRNKTGGVHAGGLIISSKRIDGFVPLEVRSVKADNPRGVVCSAWPEGLHTQDLQPVGLIKYDLLVIANLKQIAYAGQLVKQRHGLESICARPGDWDWSDIAYLNDPDAIKMADKADLRCIFQFDGEGIRKIVKQGGVSSFNDLAAYSALYRPGPLNMGMGDRYTKRKHYKERVEGKRKPTKYEEPYTVHPVMDPILGPTYGVMVYQEQVMDILRVVGKIPDMHTEKVRKAISKKKVKQFIKYKEMFLTNGQKVLNANLDTVQNLWEQIESFAEYGFNKSHAYAYTYISSRLLWLKTHYPLEFYTAVLMCENEDEKFKIYRLDALNHGVNVLRVDVNKSKDNFSINDGDIYFGFEKIKGIGEAVAKRIVASQPYTDFEDFLDKFGTDLGPVRALVSLGVFDHLDTKHSRLTLRKFHEYYKDKTKKRRERKTRFEASLEKKKEGLSELLLTQITADDPDFEAMCQFTEEARLKWAERFEGIVREIQYKYKGDVRTREVTFLKMLEDVYESRESSIRNFNQKEKESEENPLSIDQFNEDSIKLDDEEIAILTDELAVDGMKGYPMAEKEYYGFQWIHRLETCPTYEGMTIDKFLRSAEEEGLAVGCIEVEITAVRRATTKSNVDFYKVNVEDANGKAMTVHVWNDDFTRFQDELKKGTMMKMRVRPPSGGFNTLTFESVPKRDRKNLPPKDADYRIVLMHPMSPENKPLDMNEFTFDETAIEGLEEVK